MDNANAMGVAPQEPLDPDVPKHLQVRDYLLRQARSREPGARLESERELADAFGVARMTVRQAIEGLVVQGLLERVAGKGTFVASPVSELQMRLSSFSEELGRRGKSVETRTIFALKMPPNATIARALEIDDTAELAHWRRVRSVDGEAIAVQDTYVPLSVFPDFVDEPPSGSFYVWLAARALVPTWGEDAVAAASPNAEQADLLGIESTAPVLRVTRRAFCREVPIEVTRSVCRSDRYSLWVPVVRPPHLEVAARPAV